MSSGNFCYEYERPMVTVDVICRYIENGISYFLLIQRKHNPHAGKFALPGGFIEMNEPLEISAIRELKEETGIQLLPSEIEFLNIYGTPGRDPRGRVITATYMTTIPKEKAISETVAGDDAGDAKWFGLDNLPELAFDHLMMISDAKNKWSLV